VVCGFLNFFVFAYAGTLCVSSCRLALAWSIARVTFIHVFSLTGITALRFGVSTATVAMKLGLVIPVMLAFFVYHEEDAPGTKVAGIICALVAVVLSSYKETGRRTIMPRSKGPHF
jgi:uncharacterized PurR-regulated membrane protein YhhQ (DUF165 family)